MPPSWTEVEDRKLLLGYAIFEGHGNDRWAKIATRFPGKTADAIHQRFNKIKRTEAGAWSSAPEFTGGDVAVAAPVPTKGRKRCNAVVEANMNDEDDGDGGDGDGSQPKKAKTKAGAAAKAKGGKKGGATSAAKVKSEPVVSDEDEDGAEVEMPAAKKAGTGAEKGNGAADFGAFKGAGAFDDVDPFNGVEEGAVGGGQDVPMLEGSAVEGSGGFILPGGEVDEGVVTS